MEIELGFLKMKAYLPWLLLISAGFPLIYSSSLDCKKLEESYSDSNVNLTNCNIIEDALEKLRELQMAENTSAENTKPHLRSPESRVFAFLKSSRYVKSLGFSARVQLYALQEFRLLTRFSGKQLFEEAKKFFGNSVLDIDNLTDDIPDDLYRTLYLDPIKCPLTHRHRCPHQSDYRTYDGSCNNFVYPTRGSANRAFARFLDADYADDIEIPRVASDGSELPSARAISLILFESRPGNVSGIHTQLAMGFGQFLDHDLTLTPVSKLLKDGELVDFDCGESGCETAGANHSECYPIPVNSTSDPDFSNKRCLMFVRSQEFLKDDCEIGPREQVNAITAWIDASHVYGSSEEEFKHLRDSNRRRGKMKTSKHPLNSRTVKYKDLLPTQEDPACRGITDTVKCFLAGDERQNEQIGLTSFHTVMVRMHNVIEGHLKRVRPRWKGGKLFEESRKIFGAIWQSIVFKEYLPVILGAATMDKYKLWLQKPGKRYYGYDRSVNSNIRNAFSAAAFRFGHSMIGDGLSLTNHDYSQVKLLPFATVLFNPTELYNLHFNTTSAVDAVILGQILGGADPCDRFFTRQITVKLFADQPLTGKGTDLSALNIQRGRDHGLPGYTKYLEFCGDPVPKTFSELKYMDNRTKEKLGSIYRHPDDIDLFAGGISERSMEGGIVGPTFACIIAQQFRALKDGDRFWFENRKSKFTQEQIDSIKKFTLSKLFCETLDRVEKIQPYALLQPMHEAAAFLQASPEEMYKYSILYKGNSNERVTCDELPNIDYSLWSDKTMRRHYRYYRRYKKESPFDC